MIPAYELVKPEPYEPDKPRTVRQWIALRLTDPELGDELACKDFFKEYDWMLINNDDFMKHLTQDLINDNIALEEALQRYFVKFFDTDEWFFKDDPRLLRLSHTARKVLSYRLQLSLEI